MEITFPTRACVQRGLCENTVGESGHVRVSRHGQSRLGWVQKHGQSSRTIVNCYERELQWSKEHRSSWRSKNTGKESKEGVFTHVHSQHESPEFVPYTGLETVTKMHTGLGAIVATYTR